MSLHTFLRESFLIEGIDRDPTRLELDATSRFLAGPLDVESVCRLQEYYAPAAPLRTAFGADVGVGEWTAEPGGPGIENRLADILEHREAPWERHVNFLVLHPFPDGNGRTARAIWAWDMLSLGADPFADSFLWAFGRESVARGERIWGRVRRDPASFRDMQSYYYHVLRSLSMGAPVPVTRKVDGEHKTFGIRYARRVDHPDVAEEFDARYASYLRDIRSAFIEIPVHLPTTLGRSIRRLREAVDVGPPEAAIVTAGGDIVEHLELECLPDVEAWRLHVGYGHLLREIGE